MVFSLINKSNNGSNAPLADFDTQLRSAITRRLALPDPLPPTALYSLTQPVGKGHGGIGLLPLENVAAAAKWASAAASAADVERFESKSAPLPFQLDRNAAYATLVRDGIAVADDAIASYTQIEVSEEEAKEWLFKGDPRLRLLPADSDAIVTFYENSCRIPQLQRTLSACLASERRRRFVNDPLHTRPVQGRLYSCSARESGLWLQPSLRTHNLSDDQFEIAFRYRLGLDPVPFKLVGDCVLCGLEIKEQWHALSCKKLQGKKTNAHDSVMRLLGRYATSNDVINSLHLHSDGKLVPDGEFHLPRETVLVDHSGVHSMSSSNRNKVPGAGVKIRAREKVNKYRQHALDAQARFVPLIADRFGRLHGEFHKFIALIDANSLQCGTPSATRMSQSQFEIELAVLWQQWTAKIVYSYLQRCRKARYGAFRAARG